MSTAANRKAPEGHVERPTLTLADWDRQAGWWKIETGISRWCPWCGAQMMNEPPMWERYGRVVCGLGSGCNREIAWITGVGL